jgi:two-component SAPR family response regulator
LRKTEPARKKPDINPTLLEKAIKMYQGHFLSEEEGKPWAASFRERLRSKYLRAVTALGDYWQEQGKASRKDRAKPAIEKAIDCYQ